MWHRVTYVAETRALDPEKLVEFALAHVNQYHIDATIRKDPCVNTWNVDQFVLDARKELEACQTPS